MQRLITSTHKHARKHTDAFTHELFRVREEKTVTRVFLLLTQNKGDMHISSHSLYTRTALQICSKTKNIHLLWFILRLELTYKCLIYCYCSGKVQPFACLFFTSLSRFICCLLLLPPCSFPGMTKIIDFHVRISRPKGLFEEGISFISIWRRNCWKPFTNKVLRKTFRPQRKKWQKVVKCAIMLNLKSESCRHTLSEWLNKEMCGGWMDGTYSTQGSGD